MNLAILGATGQVGHALHEAARGRGDMNPVVIDRGTLDLDDLDAIGPALDGLEFDVLINCAGYTAVDRAESEPEAAFRRNAYAVEAVAAACARKGARLVQLSTDYVFDGEADRPYRPGDAPGPLNVYGASKLAGEALARRAHGAGTLIVRTSSVFGVAGRGEGKGNFVETILRRAGAGEGLRVVSDVTMAPTYAADLAGAVLGLLEAGAGPGAYHVTNGGRATWRDFAEAIVEAAGVDVPVDPVPLAEYRSAARRPRFSVLDTKKVDALVGPLPPWRDGLDRYLEARAS